MNHFDVDDALKTMTVIVDTREQDTEKARQRMRRIGVKTIREKLDFGDYSVRCSCLDLRDQVAIERKMSLVELSQCFFQNRSRFKREFERAKEKNAKIYLLVEGGSFEKIYRHQYKTKVNPKAYIASLLAWLARYDCQIIFCDELTSGDLIHDILYRELKERLEAMPDGTENN